MTATEVEAAAAYKRGTSVEVTAQTARGPRTFRSTVEYMDLKSMWITAPTEERAQGVATGTELRVVAENSGFRYEATVQLKELISKPEQLWRIDRPSAIDRKKRRAMVRQDVSLPHSRLRVEHEGRDDIEGLEFNVDVVDLSTGGTQFESIVEILEGSGLVHTLILDLPHRSEDEPLEIELDILDSKMVAKGELEVRLYRAKFSSPPPKTNSEVTRHLYMLQLDARKGSDDPRRGVREDPMPHDQGIGAMAIGNKVTLECFSPEGDLESWVTTIQDVDDEQISVLAPLYRGGAVAIDASKEIRLVTYSPRINALVVARTKRIGVQTEPLLMWQLGMPEEFFRRHQRSHVRMEVNLDGKLHISDPSADPPIDRGFEVIVVDMSAGGAAFQIPQRLPVSTDATVELVFELPSSRMPFEIRVAIVGDVQQRRLVDRTTYSYKCQFMNLSDRRQDEVTRYIFAEQLERRRQGMA